MTGAAPYLAGLERNAVVAASAGTGKTHLLTNIFLAHVLGLRSDGEAIAPERIVATTFSRAAAREIRERLELRLSILCGEADPSAGIGLDDTLEALVQVREVSPDLLRERAARALEGLPRTLVDTLHGLSIRLLRQHALELGLPPGFGILDEHEASEEARATIEEVLARALTQGPARALSVRALIELCQGLENTGTAVAQLLSLLDEEGLTAEELWLPDHARDAATLREGLGSAASVVSRCDADHPLRPAAQASLDALSGLPASAPALHEALVALTKPNRPQLEKLPEGRHVLGAIELLLGKKSKDERIRASVQFLCHAQSLDVEAHGVRALLKEIQQELLGRRRARGRFAFGDLLRLSRDALRDRPDLAVRSITELDLLLVDEFQDTSRVQRDLVLLLREAPGNAQRRTPGQLPEAGRLGGRGLVVVGDRKQSIYAFRGADVSVFARLAAELAGEPAVTALELRGVRGNPHPVADLWPLTKNYRSRPEILDFVNRVARADFAETPQKAYQIRFMPSETLVAPERNLAPGRVTLLLDDGSLPPDPDPMLSAASDALRAALLAAAYCARAHRSGTRFRDLALLARRRATLPLLELALDRLGIPFVVSGRALYATQEVRDLAALLRIALDPLDRHALGVIARGPLGGLSDGTLAALSDPSRGLLPFSDWGEQGALSDEQWALVEELRERLAEVCQIGPRLSPRDFLAFAVERFELESLFGSLPRGLQRVGNVGRLLEIAARHGGSLPQFVRWLDRQIALDVDEHEAAVFSEDDDAVRLLTVHASKGLSFPVAIVLDLGVAERPRAPALALMRRDDGSAELSLRHRNDQGAVLTAALGRTDDDATLRAHAERQRLSYVALTRAERELVLVLPPSTQKPPENTLAKTLLGLFAQLGDDFGAALTRLYAVELLNEAPLPTTPLELPGVDVARPMRAPWHSATVGVTALSDFAICPRRFQLLHVLGLAEPSPAGGSGGDGDGAELARALGSAAHRVLEHVPRERLGEPTDEASITLALEREGLDPRAATTRSTAAGIARFLAGSYARELRAHALRVHRELELTLVLLPGRVDVAQKQQLELFAPAPTEKRGVLRATLDLVVERSDGIIDVIDYKRSRGGGARRYALQLMAYRAAVAQNLPSAKIRTGLVHLLGDDEQPEWVEPNRADLYGLITQLAEARYSHDFPPVPKKRCQEAHCGFLPACYPSQRG